MRMKLSGIRTRSCSVFESHWNRTGPYVVCTNTALLPAGGFSCCPALASGIFFSRCCAHSTVLDLRRIDLTHTVGMFKHAHSHQKHVIDSGRAARASSADTTLFKAQTLPSRSAMGL